MKMLRCSCCGGIAYGKQWWNRDKGYGLCMKCADTIEAKEGLQALLMGYGIRGIHICEEPMVESDPEPTDYFLSHSTGEKQPLPLE